MSNEYRFRSAGDGKAFLKSCENKQPNWRLAVHPNHRDWEDCEYELVFMPVEGATGLHQEPHSVRYINHPFKPLNHEQTK